MALTPNSNALVDAIRRRFQPTAAHRHRRWVLSCYRAGLIGIGDVMDELGIGRAAVYAAAQRKPLARITIHAKDLAATAKRLNVTVGTIQRAFAQTGSPLRVIKKSTRPASPAKPD